MKTEDFPISGNVLEKWINHNKTTIIRSDGDKTKRYIYINLSMVRLQTAWIMPKILFALGMAEQSGAKVIAVTWHPNADLKRLFDSYGIALISLEETCRKDVKSFLFAGLKTMGIMFHGGSGEKLKKLKLDNIPVGCAIYEDILRTSDLSTIYNVFNFTCVKKIFHLLWMHYSLNRYLTNHPPVFCVSDDLAYHEGMQLALFHSHGAGIRNVSGSGMGKVEFDEHLRTVRWHYMDYQYCHEHIHEVDDNGVMATEKYLEERFQGKNGRNIDKGAFAGKKVWSREDGIRELSLDPAKKNIVIMAHTFTDAVFNYGDIYFRDYYDWTEQTLRIAGSINDVNWILKPHPTRRAYHESKDSIENMYEKYKKDNIFILSDEVSAESIKNIADAIITIGGNAGAEFACFGIPAVIVGTPYYKGFGYTLEPKSFDQYESCLKKMCKIKPLNDEQVIKAKKVFYLQNIRKKEGPYDDFNDEFANILGGGYTKMLDEMAIDYFEKNDGTMKYNDEITIAACKYLLENDYRKTAFYQAGKLAEDF